MSVKTNAKGLVSVSVMGNVAAPSMAPLPAIPYAVDAQGESFLLPMYGSIVYNVSVGDSAYNWLSDCIHPGASIAVKDEMGNRGLNILACVGNTAVVMTGSANGAQGVVTGKSGRFSDQVIVHFPQADLYKLAIGDKIIIRTLGVGLQLEDHPNIKVKSCDPKILDALEVTTLGNGKLGVPVSAKIPAHLLGAGAGLSSESGALHIQTADRAALAEAGLDGLRIGDIVALTDYDGTWGHGYRRGAVGIGVVSSGDSPRAGYGPGITLLLTSANGGIEPSVTPGVNLKDILNI